MESKEITEIYLKFISWVNNLVFGKFLQQFIYNNIPSNSIHLIAVITSLIPKINAKNSLKKENQYIFLNTSI